MSVHNVPTEDRPTQTTNTTSQPPLRQSTQISVPPQCYGHDNSREECNDIDFVSTLNAHISFNVQPLHCKCLVMYIYYTVMYVLIQCVH